MTRLFVAEPFIIAEVGSNWTTQAEAMHSITAAAVAGADAVKFQAFNRRALYGYDNGGGSSQHTLPIEWLPELAAQAKDLGIEFMCTAFSPKLVLEVDPYVEVHKVASSDLCYPQLLEAVAETGKPVLLSTGASSAWEREQAAKVLENVEDVLELYCVAAYPADYVDFDLLEQYDGFSDHTLGITAAVEAARMGAKVIEKHFTAFPDLETPDRPHSITPEQFSTMVKIIRDKDFQVTQEVAMQLRHKRRLIATRNIEQGETLTFGFNFGAYRSLKDDTRGLSPFLWRQVEDKRAAKVIARGESIGDGDFE